MKPRLFLLLFMAMICSADAADRKRSNFPKRNLNRDSIVAKINTVTVLKFETDKPISELRFFFNGKQIQRELVKTDKTGLYLAVVPLNHRIDLHAKVGGKNNLFTAKLPLLLRSDVIEQESYGPGKKLKLKDWTEVYTISRSDFKGKNIGSLKVEVK
ncbi:hypothetical protein Pan241w_50240 [Gimesia alba]|uniref:Uncharacterized protein n=1 Tax=Gimesia alba TaxID=2527973 RepID=A0A517RLZ5_9PLAN|nr:hypothetical protein [Gimesia alba]QDT44908.1 hypothetical protein Pan241w_50240 [Gimesia alba]